ncbi:MarR family transcriptional regulator [Sphingomonas abaci]|uniref:MarR family transcriptional regulator for hemolysin n=1 Tax=Sphingomonas abaci TaxID=237611 RepID=A0A7W7AKY2_9SPHN|nr:MarR family transcriptional regulator for hemolysin [Sphingomonas abaci]
MRRSARERRLAAGLVPVARAYRLHLDRELAGLSLSHSSALAVMLLGRMADGVRQGELAERLGVEGPTLVPLVDRIARAGLIERRGDPADRRAKTLHLTPAGRDLAERAEERSAAVRARLFAGIDDAALDAAIQVIERLQSALDAVERP